jgi:hypothetical protein
VAEEPGDLPGIEVTSPDQVRIFVEPQVEQVGQDADALAQVESTRLLSLGQGRVVQITRKGIADGLSDLHAGRHIARKRFLVYPLELEGDPRRLWPVGQHDPAGAIRQHPAQEMGIEIDVRIPLLKARSLEQPGRKLARQGHPALCCPRFHRLCRCVECPNGSCTDAGYRQSFQGWQVQFALNQVGQSRRGAIAPGRRRREEVQLLIRGKQRPNDARPHGSHRMQGIALHVDGVMPQTDPVFGQNTLLDPRRHLVDRTDVPVHAVVIHRIARQEDS